MLSVALLHVRPANDVEALLHLVGRRSGYMFLLVAVLHCEL